MRRKEEMEEKEGSCHMKQEAGKIRISVRNLVEFLLRRGSLETGTGPSSSAAMLEGARIHRMLQKKEGPDYRAEVTLRMEVPLESGSSFVLEGRADGIYCSREAVSVNMPHLLTEETDPEAGSNSAEVEPGTWMIDEIKTVFGTVRGLEEPEEVHLAQARCYAYMYAVEQDLDVIGIRMTYCSQVTGEVRYFYEVKSLEKLKSWFRDLIRMYEPWVEVRRSFAEEALSTIREMDFPFTYREGQRSLAAGVYHTIAQGRKLFLQAPTGTGKTMAVLFPALKAIGEGKAEHIWYLTARAVASQAPLEALALLQARGLRIRSVVISAKERACPQQTVDCRAEACPRAEGHYDRINGALWDLLQGAADGMPLTPGRIADCAERHRVCPYALSMDAAEFADVVIGDYNYAFHPQARLPGFLDRGGNIFLIDEAHNLLERGRDLYSADLSAAELRLFRSSVKNTHPGLWRRMKSLAAAMKTLDAGKEAEGAPVQAHRAEVIRDREELKNLLAAPVEETLREMHRILEEEDRRAVLAGGPLTTKENRNGLPAADTLTKAGGSVPDDETWQAAARSATAFLPEKETRQADARSATAFPPEEGSAGRTDPFLEFLFSLTGFQQVLEGLDENYICFTTGRGSGTSRRRPDRADRGENDDGVKNRHGRERRGLVLHLFCADPSGALRANMQKTVSVICFSATFLPIQYYKRLLGGTEDDYEMYARSAFSPSQLSVVIANDVTSRYRDRNEASYLRIADRIGRIIACRPGNYMVFFPSYQFLEKVLEAFEICCGGGSQEEDGMEYIFPLSPFSPLPVRLLVQRPSMKDAQRACYLEAFEETSADRHMAGFCVLGGMFAEGIDLRDDRLIGSIIVGTGIPPVEERRELLRDYFNSRGENGYDYAYRFPGMNKVLQAAGRVIRTEKDTGIVALMDDRFPEAGNRALFPVEWESPPAAGGEEFIRLIRAFWERHVHMQDGESEDRVPDMQIEERK